MALEAELMVTKGLPVSFTVADGAAIPKGSILKMTDPRTAAISDGDTDICAGIAAEEKVASDGKTTLAVYQSGQFKVFVGAAGATVGAAAITDSSTGAANEVVNADVNSENIVGRFLETATDTQSALMELNPHTVNLA